MDPKKFDEDYMDQDTGERVRRIKVDEKDIEKLGKHVNDNAMHANAFLQISRQILGLEEQQKQAFEAANAAEQEIGKEVIRVREEMGLDSGWIFNIPMKMMERRDPPDESKLLEEGVKEEGKKDESGTAV